ncbi:MAG: VOC family protein [Dehalococcoidia bacterium]
MKPMGVNRVTIAVEDLQKGIEVFSMLLGATFHSANEEDAARFGIEVAMSWDAGIELVAPLPDRDSHVKQFLKDRGEGLMGVIFAVDDVEEAKEAALSLGAQIWHSLDYTRQEIDEHLQGRFKKYKEYMLSPQGTCGVAPVIGQIEPSEGGQS